jgi:hypothetical protein
LDEACWRWGRNDQREGLEMDTRTVKEGPGGDGLLWCLAESAPGYVRSATDELDRNRGVGLGLLVTAVRADCGRLGATNAHHRGSGQ